MSQEDFEQLIAKVGEKHNDVIRFKSARDLAVTVRHIAKGLSLSEDRVWELIQERGFERRCQESSNPKSLATFFLMCMTDEELEAATKKGAQIDIDF